jgi:hypothetical protein
VVVLAFWILVMVVVGMPIATAVTHAIAKRMDASRRRALSVLASLAIAFAAVVVFGPFADRQAAAAFLVIVHLPPFVFFRRWHLGQDDWIGAVWLQRLR